MSRRRPWPVNIEEAVCILLDQVPEQERRRIAALPRNALIDLDLDLGAWIRSTFGLSSGNAELLESTGEALPNDSCDVLIEAFWNALRAESRKLS
jgi:hypothetical protein